MEIIYRANDGKEFFNEKDCRAYENRDMPKMWDNEGVKTDDFDIAYYIYFENTEKIKSFLRSQRVQKVFTSYMGINVDVEGLYKWNESTEEYDWINLAELKDTLLVLRQADENAYNKLF